MYVTNAFTGVLGKVLRFRHNNGKIETLVLAMPEDDDIHLAYWQEDELVIAL